MLLFCNYNLADHLAHWCRIGETGRSGRHLLPRMFMIEWFRNDTDGRFRWLGHEEDARVPRWVFERVEGAGEATETPIGLVPTAAALGLEELGLPAGVGETERNCAYPADLGDRVPALARQQERLEGRLRTG